ncbi:DUF58 domain-containing protein [Ectopseudomonas oleovorans]|uniref:Uncharacterized protein n=1 Tax=Ectopseudomonas oleovorans (strain CECT 5344) TaxID=1182590 RepID=W6R1X5_ECTO5|nr:DUF58 domain-containing protein [Pseudomonas oleovorans]CDM40391.1 hypothetical protein BN5_1815 [Pseudomonas oleovorans CECT 5344]CDR91021.1 hypothetical protein PPSAL_1794 [Pseudomonas oleovorans]
MRAALKPLWQRWLARRIPPAASVRLNQRRIFILPSRVGGAFAVALLLMLLVGINYQNSLAYGLTFLLMAVFVVTILHTYRNLAGLVLKAGGGAAVFVGEQACFRVRLESREREHQAIALGWPPAELMLRDVPRQGQTEVDLSQPAVRRGWLRPERLRVESRFPLGLLVAWSWVDLDQAVLVYPRPLEGELPLSAGLDDEEEEGMRARGQGADDFQGLREYQPGDSKRRLDWKAYSRGQGLLVKDFAMLSGHDLWLDFDSLGGDSEMRLSLLCYWVLQFTERQQTFGLQLPGQVIAPDYGEGHRDVCLRALALFGARA